MKDLVIFSERFVLSDIKSHVSFNNLLVNALETQEIKQKWFNLTFRLPDCSLQTPLYIFPLLLIDYLHLNNFYGKLDIHNYNTGKELK